jgi:hypothetical protein
MFRKSSRSGLHFRSTRGRYSPLAEPLEGRTLCALGFASAFGLAASFASPPQVAIDSIGDTFITGSFSGTANFDPAMSSAAVLSARAGVADTFVAKYSSTGALAWVEQFATVSSGTQGDGNRGTGIVVDSTGSVYVVGQFQGMVNFNPAGSPTVRTSSSTTTADAYIVKLAPAGSIVADVEYGNGMGGPEFNGLALSPDGQSIYVTGGFTGTVNFDPAGPATALTAPVDGDAFALALSSSLGFSFVQQANLDSAEGSGIAVLASGAVAIDGVIATTHDAFVARFIALGNAPAERLFLGAHAPTMAALADALVTDGTNIYLAGTFKGIGVNFNGTTGTQAVTLDSRGGSDAFLIKLDSRLDIDWAFRFGSPGNDSATALAIDPSGNLYLTGSVSGLATYGTTGLGTAIFYPGNGLSSMPDTYVLEVDSNGNPMIPPSGPTGSGSSAATSIAVNNSDEVAIVGLYSPPIIFGTTLLQAPGTTVPFLATLSVSSNPGGNNGGSTGAGGGGGTPIGSGSAPALVLTGERRLTTGRGRRKMIVGFELDFSAPLDPESAGSPGAYQVTQPGRTRRTPRKLIPVLAATLPSPGASSVTLTLGNFDKKKPLLLTAAGLRGADGTPAATIVTRL